MEKCRINQHTDVLWFNRDIFNLIQFKIIAISIISTKSSDIHMCVNFDTKYHLRRTLYPHEYVINYLLPLKR